MGERGCMAGRVNRGEIWLFHFSAPDKRRPVLVLTRSQIIPFVSAVMVAPITSAIRGAPSEVLVGIDEGLKRDSAVNLDRGDLQWQVPYGETPDAVRNHPALKGLNIGNTGQPGSVGLLVTKTLVVLGDSQITSVTHPRGAMLRAYDKTTGKEVGSVLMPAPQSGSPMTYSVDGKQYIVVAVSGGAYSGEYIAYSLPAQE